MGRIDIFDGVYFGGHAVDCRDFDPQLCIVQLTDFHFDEELRGNYQKRVNDILETIKNSIKSGTVLLLVTGDVARTGKGSEYQSAVCSLII